jgi:predicted site-specific integrase-resolvase
MKSKEVLNILKITRPTLTKYVKQGRIKTIKNPNGFYEYDEDDVFKAANISPFRKCVIYARVSTQKQKHDLQKQIDTIREYANKNGYTVDSVYSDIASGLNYDRGEFKNMVNDIINHNIKTVIISDKDRLTRVSFNMWEQLFEHFSCKLIVVNNDNNENENSEKEIFEDIISLLHCFAMRMYSSRRKKKITLIEEDMKNEIGL